ncbi:uncharacterized protein Dsimw501_GD27460 [Drosophila simulans]|uniref:Uncharacterized protein n=1 Tax=Drosophila simulans TaxID=7240 RepID=A0A0J9QYY8_DROSI|nr:uncharacterized protein Dsimw501_GD27460 [Drosophila simulans]
MSERLWPKTDLPGKGLEIPGRIQAAEFNGKRHAVWLQSAQLILSPLTMQLSIRDRQIKRTANGGSFDPEQDRVHSSPQAMITHAQCVLCLLNRIPQKTHRDQRRSGDKNRNCKMDFRTSGHRDRTYPSALKYSYAAASACYILCAKVAKTRSYLRSIGVKYVPRPGSR